MNDRRGDGFRHPERHELHPRRRATGTHKYWTHRPDIKIEVERLARQARLR